MKRFLKWAAWWGVCAGLIAIAAITDKSEPPPKPRKPLFLHWVTVTADGKQIALFPVVCESSNIVVEVK